MALSVSALVLATWWMKSCGKKKTQNEWTDCVSLLLLLLPLVQVNKQVFRNKMFWMLLAWVDFMLQEYIFLFFFFFCCCRNPKGTVQVLNKVYNDVGQRAQNLSVLIYHIKSYYQVSHREKCRYLSEQKQSVFSEVKITFIFSMDKLNCTDIALTS